MRDYREVARRVLERRDHYVKEQKTRQKRTAAAAGCVSLAVVVGIMAWAGPGPQQEGALLDAPLLVQDFALDQERGTQTEAGIPDQSSPAPGKPADAERAADAEKPAVRETPKAPASRPAPKKEAGKQPQTKPSVQREARVSAGAPVALGAPQVCAAGLGEDLLTGSGGDVAASPVTPDAPVQENPIGLGEGQIFYTDVWGGSYLDQDGNMVVLLTQDTPENREAVFQRNPAFLEDQVRFQTADYTLEYLTQVQEDISAAMVAGELPFVAVSALREAENRVQVTVTSQEEEDLARVRAFDPQGGAIQVVTPDEIEDLCALPLAPATEQTAETE